MNTRTFSAPACIEILEGRIAPAVVAAIALGDLDGSDGFKLSGVADLDLAGGSVSAAGDVNGDGFGDFIIGADQAGPNGSFSGASYVVFGKAGGFPAALPLSGLDGTTGFRLAGVAVGDRAGSSVGAAGDVNGDGFADLIVGAYKADSLNGAAYVVFGRADFSGTGGNFNLSGLDGDNGFKLAGDSGSKAGSSVSGAGDVNGDGFADVIVGAPFAAPNRSGASYVVFGKAGGFAASIALADVDGTDGFTLSGVAEIDYSGDSVSGAGDLNGDGFADFIIGAISADEGGLDRGAGYVVFGKADFSGTAGTLALASLNGTNGFKLRGVANFDLAGSAVSGAGDVNGDGFADLLIGAKGVDEGGSGRGAGYVVFGKADFSGTTGTLALASLNGTNGFRLSGVADFDLAGSAVSGAGDVNGDGFADLLVGALRANEGGVDRGAGYVVFGKADFSGTTGTLALASLNGTNGFKVSGAVTGDSAGAALSGAGDVNGDGFADLIIGAPDADGSVTNSGVAYVVFGFGTGAAMVSADGKTATFTDVDGDAVTLKSSKGGLTVERLHLSQPNALGGSRLVSADFTDPIFAGSNITLTAKAVPRAGVLGDGLANVGSIFAGANALGTVKLDGDLAQLDAGAVKSLTVQSLGRFPVAPQGAPGTSALAGLGALSVKTSWTGVDVAVTGALGKTTVGGTMRDATLSATTVGAVKIAGDLDDVRLLVRGTLNPTAKTAVALKSLTVGGSLSASTILLGYTAAGVPVNADVQAGAVTVKGSWIASSFIAGTLAGTDDLFGTAADAAIGGGNAIVSKIASITIGGQALGTADAGDHFGIVAQQIGGLKIGKAKAKLTKTGLDVVELLGTRNFTVREVA